MEGSPILFSQCYSMEFPPLWTVFLDKVVDGAMPWMEGKATMELLTQVRHTRRILGNFRVGLYRASPK
jgi:hypothetical protein